MDFEPYLLPEQLGPFDKWCRRLVFLIGVPLVLFFLLAGCASYEYDWKRTNSASVKPWLYVTVADVDATCRSFGTPASTSRRINGCAQWKPVGCIIILPHNSPKWIKEHEERHCEGWVH